MVRRCLKNATLQVLVAMLCGLALGLWRPALATSMRPLSDGFVAVIGLTVPIVMFVLVVSGVAGLRGRRGRAGLAGRVLLYFQALSLLALCTGCLVALLLQPGNGLSAAPPMVPDGGLMVRGLDLDGDGTAGGQAFDVPRDAVPAGLAAAFRHSPVLQILLAALLAGLALPHLGACGARLEHVLEQVVDRLFRLLRFILRFAPLAAFGAMAFTVGHFGPGAVLPLVKFVGTIYFASILFVCLVLATLARMAGARLTRLVAYVKEELVLVAFTGASVAALPGLVTKLERLGCARDVVRLVMTTGYTFNLNGSNLYLTTALVFLAQAAHVELTAGLLATLLPVCLLTSLGSTSVAGSALLTLAATLGALHLVPVESVGLLLGVERLMKCRSLTNVLGNCVACLALSRWQGALDRDALRRELGGAALAVPG
ncbi:cation:dicarboxylate symporter family transporter [Azotobacter vinelandii]|uniref:cation:dicarboxylate symporter family transporter n=1 Tax=Azotobacter vinelandii TaxID=354 RepID=UPI0026671C13|nr:cation:dicarboxylase symporter family transporter [Azotobacter vinelandii]WKN21809.1 cation:dicarboxylase symporter family transporter [Azotobacter vinelandii]